MSRTTLFIKNRYSEKYILLLYRKLGSRNSIIVLGKDRRRFSSAGIKNYAAKSVSSTKILLSSL